MAIIPNSELDALYAEIERLKHHVQTLIAASKHSTSNLLAEIERLKADIVLKDVDVEVWKGEAKQRADRIRDLQNAADLLKVLFGHPQTAIKFEPGGALIQCALDNDGLRTLHQAQTLHPNWFTIPLPAQLVSGLPSVSPNPKESEC